MYARGASRLPRTLSVGVTSALAVALLLAACSTAAGSLTTSGAWARPGTAGGETAAYLVINNPGSLADTLVSASSPAAASVGLHQTSKDSSGMVGMHPVAGIPIPAGGAATLEPGGMHLMLMGLTRNLTAGGSLDLDLVFKNAGTVRVKADVRQP